MICFRGHGPLLQAVRRSAFRVDCIGFEHWPKGIARRLCVGAGRAREWGATPGNDLLSRAWPAPTGVRTGGTGTGVFRSTTTHPDTVMHQHEPGVSLRITVDGEHLRQLLYTPSYPPVTGLLAWQVEKSGPKRMRAARSGKRGDTKRHRQGWRGPSEAVSCRRSLPGPAGSGRS